MWTSLWTAALLSAAAFVSTISASHQFHLSLVGDADYMLDWVTPTTTNSSVLLYGTSQTKLDQSIKAKAAGTVEQSAGAEVTCWSALLHNLKPGTTIYYTLKDADDSTATPFSFTVPATSITWAVFGDLAAPMQKQAAAVSLPALKKELLAGAFQGLLNLGDISYELVKANGEDYMEALQDVGSKVPIQTTIGNHEHEHAMAPEFALRNYNRRFAGITLGAGAVSGSASNEFFSFTSGLVHFVFINTEVYGDEAYFAQQPDESWKPDEVARRAVAVAQASWLEYDLSRVDRTVTPYVVMCGHRPPFKTPGGLAVSGNKFLKEIMPLISQYDVDLYLSGHEHTYLVYDESKVGEYRMPPIIISGSPGNNEFIREESKLNIVGFKYKTMIPKYGYGYLTATETALEWKWGSAGTDGSRAPKPKDWTLEDTMSIPRRKVSSPTTKSGTPVKEPEAVETQWTQSNIGGSGANSGSTGAPDDTVTPGTVIPADMGNSTLKTKAPASASPTPTTSSSSAAGNLQLAASQLITIAGLAILAVM